VASYHTAVNPKSARGARVRLDRGEASPQRTGGGRAAENMRSGGAALSPLARVPQAQSRAEQSRAEQSRAEEVLVGRSMDGCHKRRKTSKAAAAAAAS